MSGIGHRVGTSIRDSVIRVITFYNSKLCLPLQLTANLLFRFNLLMGHGKYKDFLMQNLNQKPSPKKNKLLWPWTIHLTYHWIKAACTVWRQFRSLTNRGEKLSFFFAGQQPKHHTGVSAPRQRPRGRHGVGPQKDCKSIGKLVSV